MTTKRLDLYYFPECPYCQLVLQVIAETNLTQAVVLKNIHQDQQALEKLIKDTGRRTVPCLYIDGVPMHESRDIAYWLKKYAQERGQ